MPDFLLERRLDHVAVIGHALALGIAAGLGIRMVADQVGVPMTTARAWRRRFQVRAPVLAAALMALAVHLGPTAVLLTSDGETAALEALGAAWQRARTRFGEHVPAVWRFGSLIRGGQALGTKQKPARDTWIRSGLDGAISLTEVRMNVDPREAIALLRYRIVAEATNPRLTPGERGQLVRELANQAYEHPDGSSWTYSRGTLDRWVRAYREGGLDGLRPPPRADLGFVRRHTEPLEEACQLRLELPGRSAAQIG